MILLISGIPGQGKTTISNTISRKTSILVIHLDQFFAKWYKSTYNEEALAPWQSKKVDKTKFIDCLLSYIEEINKPNLIIEGYQLGIPGFQLGTLEVLKAISGKYDCVSIVMWAFYAYHNKEAIGSKDDLGRILKLCGFSK